MEQSLRGRRVAILVEDGFEQVELTEPRQALIEAGAEVHVVSPRPEKVKGWNYTQWGDEVRVQFVKSFMAERKPVAVICHGPWTLVEADVVRGRRITSWPSLKTDLRNAGAEWVDEPVVVDQGLVSSRKPDDIPAFNAKMIEEFREGRHVAQRAA
jgi:protease I